MQYNIMQCNTMQCNAIQYNTVQWCKNIVSNPFIAGNTFKSLEVVLYWNIVVTLKDIYPEC